MKVYIVKAGEAFEGPSFEKAFLDKDKAAVLEPIVIEDGRRNTHIRNTRWILQDYLDRKGFCLRRFSINLKEILSRLPQPSYLEVENCLDWCYIKELEVEG